MKGAVRIDRKIGIGLSAGPIMRGLCGSMNNCFYFFSIFFKNFKNVLNGAWKKQSIKIRSLGTITIRQSRVKFEIPFDFDDEYRLQDYL